MITIENHRILIGIFNMTCQINLRSVCRNMKIGSMVTSHGFSRFLKLFPFITAVFFCYIFLLQSGDVESNPGPLGFRKILKASTHQGNAIIYGATAGSQCMFMSISSIVISNIKALHYWSQNDLDLVLKTGNDLYGSFGYINDFLGLTDLPEQFQISNNLIQFEKTSINVSIMSKESRNFIDIPAGYNSGIFLCGSSGISFMFHNSSYYLFDSHSRNSEGMCGGNNGTSILLVFNTKYDLENYLKTFKYWRVKVSPKLVIPSA